MLSFAMAKRNIPESEKLFGGVGTGVIRGSDTIPSKVHFNCGRGPDRRKWNRRLWERQLSNRYISNKSNSYWYPMIWYNDIMYYCAVKGYFNGGRGPDRRKWNRRLCERQLSNRHNFNLIKQLLIIIWYDIMLCDILQCNGLQCNVM